MSSWRILVVDDEAGMLRSVQRVLSPSYQVAGTRSAREVMVLAGAFRPDLAILDVQMPDMDGFELMEELRALDPDIDVIFMTGSIHELDAKLIRAIRKDAFYFLQKPFDRGVILSLVDRCLELKALDRSNREHVLRLERELGDARAFQQSILAPRFAEVGGVSIFAQYVPSSELAGDFYDYVALPSGGAVLLVADVSGHGASAAMLTGVVKSAFHSVSGGYEPACVVKRIASGIRAFGAHHFITLICVRVQNGCLEFVNAGHPQGVLLSPGTSAVLLEPTGLLISPVLKCEWQQRSMNVNHGSDRLVLFTDGIIEAESESEDYGLDRLIDEVSKPIEGRALSEQVVDSVRRFAVGCPKDDLTLVIADL